jgi:hypothetical protein
MTDAGLNRNNQFIREDNSNLSRPKLLLDSEILTSIALQAPITKDWQTGSNDPAQKPRDEELGNSPSDLHIPSPDRDCLNLQVGKIRKDYTTDQMQASQALNPELAKSIIQKIETQKIAKLKSERTELHKSVWDDQTNNDDVMSAGVFDKLEKDFGADG